MLHLLKILDLRRGRLLSWLCEEHQGEQSLPARHGHEVTRKRPSELLSELIFNTDVF